METTYKDSSFLEAHKEMSEEVYEHRCLAFVRWYIHACQRQGVPVDGVAYDLPDAYADYVESVR